MKIDMSPDAVTARLRQASQLRRACLSLACSSAGQLVRRVRPGNPLVRRTSEALGDDSQQ